MKTPKRKALNSTQGQTKASSDDTSSPQEMPESIYTEYIDGLIGQYGTGDSALMSEIETIRKNPRLLKIYNAQRAYQESNLPLLAAYSDAMKSQLIGPDLSESVPPKAVREYKHRPATSAPKTLLRIPGAKSWDEVSMRFLEHNRVAVSVKEKQEGIYDFSEFLGFMDRRTKTPNDLWELLNEIAEDNGLFKIRASDFLNAKNQLLKRLQKELKGIFGLDVQPFKPFRRKTAGRLARFSLMPRPFKQY